MKWLAAKEEKNQLGAGVEKRRKQMVGKKQCS